MRAHKGDGPKKQAANGLLRHMPLRDGGEAIRIMKAPHLRLGVNIDHVATVRNARGGSHPDPVRAAQLAILAGADSITAHLREDRRHIRDDDMVRLKDEIIAPLNFEMAPTAEMIAMAMRIRPHAACLVPEKREERTTEGGLDIIAGHDHLHAVVRELRDAGIRVSLFVEPEVDIMEAARALEAPVVELHTGSYCDVAASGDEARTARELERLRRAAEHGARLGLEIHAGHGLNFDNVRAIAAIPQVVELNIGHHLVGEALFTGLGEAIDAMRAAMDRGRELAGR
jgi:pyridoxine 5-phosphate synthase